MNPKDSISILAQTDEGLFLDNGIRHDTCNVIGIDADLGLMVLASGESQTASSPTYKAVEIMMDDMQLNLSASQDKTWPAVSIASLCLTESIDNINEYLCPRVYADSSSDSNQGVELLAVQFFEDAMSCCNIGSMQCLIFSDNKLRFSGSENEPQLKLGISSSIETEIPEYKYIADDVILLLSSGLLEILDFEFIRMTLSRFSENLDMALRQINTRAMQNGLKQKPFIIICKINQLEEKPRSWFARLTGDN